MQTIAGFRLVRLLARGTHSEVWLGAADAAATPTAIKLFHPGTPLIRVDTEVEALGRVSHRHVQRLLDISVDPSGRTCLVLARLGPSLARVLADRDRLAAGEAVTMLAPVCEALNELHRVGVAHGRLDAGSILFDATGAPVLTCFGGAVLVGDIPHPPKPSSLTPAQQDRDDDLAHDRESLATLAEQVLGRIDGNSSVRDWLATRPATTGEFAAELAERLHSSAPAAPVALPRGDTARAVSRAGESTLAMRSRPARGTPDERDTADDAPSTGGHDEATRWFGGTAIGSLLPPWLAERFSHWLARKRTEWFGEHASVDTLGVARAAASRVRSALRHVRPRVWVVAAAGVLAVIVAIVVVGADASPPAEAQPGPAETAVEPSHEPSRAPSEPAVVDRAHDPVTAARILLDRREQCFRELSVLCLDDTDQAGSAAMEADRHTIRELEQGAAHPDRLDWSDAELALIDQLGDGVLVDASLQPISGQPGAQPRTATLLLVRTDEGWRIRDLIE